LNTDRDDGTVSAMSNQVRSVQMHIIDPGTTEVDGEFSFELQPRYNAARTVKFALIPSDAELLYKRLGEYLAAQAK